MTHPGVLHLFLGDGVVLRHLCFSVPAHTPLRCVCTGLQRQRLPDAWDYGSLYPRIPAHTPLRSATYVRGYRDSVFQTHGAMGLSIIASPRTYSAPLCMYGATQIASPRRMELWVSLSSHPPAHTPFRCVCTGLERQRLPDAWDCSTLYPNSLFRIPHL